MKLTSKKLSSSEIQDIVNKKIHWILQYSCPQKIILFGSAATEEMTESSDVDLIVLFSNNSNLKKIGIDLAKNRPKDDWPHDLLLLTQDEFEFYKNKGGGACWIAAQEGKILFERQDSEP